MDKERPEMMRLRRGFEQRSFITESSVRTSFGPA